ncbi:hypothetical protein FKO01_25255 [Mesorhizobium sp. B2-3-3]|nr:hypothetical protein FKO01_25255 [Mesorhizobium sp. B2-3-3]
MSFKWVRENYGVPARRGGRVEFTSNGRPELGTIVGWTGPHLKIWLDGAKPAPIYHPTWKLRYLDANQTGTDNG